MADNNGCNWITVCGAFCLAFFLIGWADSDQTLPEFLGVSAEALYIGLGSVGGLILLGCAALLYMIREANKADGSEYLYTVRNDRSMQGTYAILTAQPQVEAGVVGANEDVENIGVGGNVG